jgi:hypothetical protein
MYYTYGQRSQRTPAVSLDLLMAAFHSGTVGDSTSIRVSGPPQSKSDLLERFPDLESPRAKSIPRAKMTLVAMLAVLSAVEAVGALQQARNSGEVPFATTRCLLSSLIQLARDGPLWRQSPFCEVCIVGPRRSAPAEACAAAVLARARSGPVPRPPCPSST